MKRIGCSTIIFFGLLVILMIEFFPDKLNSIWSATPFYSETEVPKEEMKDSLHTKEVKEEKKEFVTFKSNTPLHKYIGVDKSKIVEVFNEPLRIDPSAYGYEWWIYPSDDKLLQFGIRNNKVVTVYGIGEELPIEPFTSNISYDVVLGSFELQQNVSLTSGVNSFRFELREEEVITRPLIEYEGVWIQLYFDQFTKKLSSIRYLNEETLLKHRPYSLTFRGQLPEEENLNDELWEQIERGYEQQIFDITNIIRVRHGLPIFEWDDDVAAVAYKHSKDMSENEFFSHTSPNTGELMDRLEADEVRFQIAGENIAAQYVDSIAAVEGWLNSEGHRVNLLNDEFSHLGVGVYRKYYTQNFLTPWDVIH